jgi:gliding motility-associated-like protein
VIINDNYYLEKKISAKKTSIIGIVILLFVFNVNSNIVAQSLSFIKNKNQWNENVLYKCKVNNDNIYLEKNSLLIDVYSDEDLSRAHELSEDKKINTEIKAHAYKVNLLNANESSELIPYGEKETYYNYLIGSNPTNWAEHVPLYQKIIEKNIYNKIDWSFYSYENNFKYDFIIHPGANINNIKLEYIGTDNLQINSEGNLIIKTSIKNISETKPYAYQIINNNKVEISCTYILNNNIVTFKTGSYDENYDVIIDPAIIMGSYSGAGDQTIANCSAFDTINNLYSSGTAIDGMYPVSTGAYRTSYAGMGDVVISKYNALGTSQIFATYLGGYLRDMSASIIIDNSNRILVCGNTFSPDFPTTIGCIDGSFAGDTINRDAYISILNNSGSALLHSTFIGGMFDEEITDIRLDNSLNIYVCGSTNSIDFTTTAGVFDNTYNGGYDAFVCKTNSTLTSLISSTFIGASANENGLGINLDKFNNIYIMGKTFSSTFPTTTSAVGRTYRGSGDGFVTRLNNSMNLLASSFISTTMADYAKMGIHDSGYVYILAYTEGLVSRYPSCKASSGFGGVFLSCYKENLDSLVYRIPITNYDVATTITAFELSDSNYFLISAFVNLIRSTFPDSIYTTDSTNRIRNKSLYFLCISKNGEDIFNASLINSYFGGHMHGSNCRFNKKNNRLFHVICSRGTETPTISAPHRFSITGGEFDMFSFIYQPTISTVTSYLPSMKINDSLFCSRGYLILQNTSVGINSYKWLLPDASSDSLNRVIFYRNVLDGANIVKLIVRRNCSTIDTLIDTFYIPRKPDGSTIRISDSINCLGTTLTFTDSILAGNRSIWRLPTSSIDSTNDTIRFTPTTSGLQSFLLITDSIQCPYRKDTTKLNFFMYDEARAIITNIDTPVCIPYIDSLRHTSIFYNKHKWTDDFGNVDSINNSFYININSIVDYNIYLQVYNSYCDNFSIDTFRIKSVAPPSASITATQTSACINEIFTFTNTSTNFTKFYWCLNDSIIDSTNNIFNQSFNLSGSYNIKLICKSIYCNKADTQSININIFPLPVAIIDTVILTACVPFTTTLFNHSIHSTNFYWIRPDLSIDSTSTTLNITHSTSGNFTYQLVAFGDSCANLSDTTSVILHVVDTSLSIFNIRDTSVCKPFYFSLENNSTNSSNYQWIFNDTLYPIVQDSIFISYLNSGIQNISLISWNTVCPDRIDTMQATINVKDDPQALAFISQTIGCPPLNINFTNQSINSDSVFWIINDTIVSTADSFEKVFITPGIFSVKIIANNNGCNSFDTNSYNIQVLQKPIAIISCNDTALCIPDTAIISNSSQYISTFYWYSPILDSTNNPLFFSQNDSGLYQIQLIVYGNECPYLSDTAYKNIYFKSFNSISINVSDTAGCNPLFVKAFLSNTNTENRWTTIPSSSLIVNTDTVNYVFTNIGSTNIEVKIYDPICIETPLIINQHIEVYPQAISTFYYSPIYLEEDSSTTFISNSSNYDSITWIIDDTFFIYQNNNLELDSLIYGTHQICLIATNSYQCNDTNCQSIFVLKKPTTPSPCKIEPVTAFTPNSDGINDRFFILAKTVENINIQVYNRWGEVVYQSSSANDFSLRNDQWDGTYNGREQPMGVYSYIITATCPLDKQQVIKTGNVSLIR